jgi:fructose-bisphosphate aldolase class II
MVDASHEPFAGNVAVTKKIVDMAHACGVPVEGELGYVAGVEGEDAEKHPGEVVYTSAEEARDYIEQTGVDFLAVSIGTVHGRMQGEPVLDVERLGQINAALGIPLVIHGGTGLSDAQFSQLIANGVAKINYYTALADAAGSRMRENMAANERSGYTGIVKGVQDAIRAEVERCMQSWGSSGQADAVLAKAETWQPVHHVIIFNVENTTDADAQEMMRKGEDILRTIPGVRRIVTGNAVQENAQYKFTWLIEFVHRNVIASYRDHPRHVAFADNLFRPVAGDRVSIDFVQN